MADRIEIPQAPPPFTSPFVDAAGKVTVAWQRWLLNASARQGGPQDDIYAVILQALVSGAQVSALYAALDQQANETAEIRSMLMVRQGYDDQIAELRGLIVQNQQAAGAVQQQLETIRQEVESNATQAVLTQISGSSAAFASATAALSGLGGKQDTITPGTTLQYWRGDETFQALNTDAVTEATRLYFTDGRALAAVVAAANTWVAPQVFDVPPALPTFVVGGLPSAATYTDGCAIATDLLAPAIGSVVVGGGAVRGLVISDGINWRAA